MQTVKGQDPVTARAAEASVDSLRIWDAADPAAVTASPPRASPAATEAAGSAPQRATWPPST